MKRKSNPLIKKLLDEIDPKIKAQIDFEMECLNDWDTCHEDILEEAKSEGIPENMSIAVLNISKYFYLKGINDAYKKLKKER